jgi:hypothetical protein
LWTFGEEWKGVMKVDGQAAAKKIMVGVGMREMLGVGEADAALGSGSSNRQRKSEIGREQRWLSIAHLG